PGRYLLVPRPPAALVEPPASTAGAAARDFRRRRAVPDDVLGLDLGCVPTRLAGDPLAGLVVLRARLRRVGAAVKRLARRGARPARGRRTGVRLLRRAASRDPLPDELRPAQ